MSGNTSTQNTRKNVRHWIGISPLDVGDVKPPGVINKRIVDYEVSVTTMRQIKPHPHMCKSKNQLILSFENQNPAFSLRMGGKNWSFEGLLQGQGPKIVYWALGLVQGYSRSEEEEQLVVKCSQLKSQRWGTSERLFEEELLLGHDECSSQYKLHQLA